MSSPQADSQKGDRRDLCAGLLLCLMGTVAAIYISGHYSLGTIRRMGPGMFPLGVSIAIVLFGLLTAASSFKANSVAGWWRIDLLALATVTGGLAAFAILLPFFGAIPAIVGLSFVSGLAVKRSSVEVVLLAISLVLMAYLIFQLGLGIQFPLVRLP